MRWRPHPPYSAAAAVAALVLSRRPPPMPSARAFLHRERLWQGRPDARRQEPARQVHRQLDQGKRHQELQGRQEGREVRAVPRLHRLRRAHLPSERLRVLGDGDAAGPAEPARGIGQRNQEEAADCQEGAGARLIGLP